MLSATLTNKPEFYWSDQSLSYWQNCSTVTATMWPQESSVLFLGMINAVKQNPFSLTWNYGALQIEENTRFGLSIKSEILCLLTLTLTLYVSQTVVCEFIGHKETLSVIDIPNISCSAAFHCWYGLYCLKRLYLPSTRFSPQIFCDTT